MRLDVMLKYGELKIEILKLGFVSVLGKVL